MIDKQAPIQTNSFSEVTGLYYLEFLERLHGTIEPKLYLEVGTQTGASLRYSNCTSISVDPNFVLKHEIVGRKNRLFCFQETSDDFFASGFLKTNKSKVDLAFLDGMYLFEFLLRDFINTEKYCTAKSVVVMHDCIPFNGPMTRRDRITKAWTGDVWKVVPILRRYRPDLDIEVVNAAPTGLVIVTNLDPKNRTLTENYDAILDEFLNLEIEEYGVERYLSSLDIVETGDSRWLSEFPLELPAETSKKPDVSIKIAARSRQVMEGWGDYHFARGLARELSRLGHRTSICAQEDWYEENKPGGIDLVIRGRANFKRQAGRRCLYWSISKGMRKMNYAQADHVFWASNAGYQDAISGHGKGISTLLPQAFDSDVMFADPKRKQKGIVFVGRRRADFERPSVKYAVEAGEDIKIYGPGWRDELYGKYVCGDHVENSELWDVYQGANIVLNDNTPVMNNRGFLSNRVLDTLACGSIPVSEDVGWLPEDIADYVYTFHDQESFEAALKKARSEPSEMKKKRINLAREIVRTHSFKARAKQILDVASKL